MFLAFFLFVLGFDHWIQSRRRKSERDTAYLNRIARQTAERMSDSGFPLGRKGNTGRFTRDG